MRPPSFSEERILVSNGYFVIGVDEAGCGCLAGPVVASAVHLPFDSRIGAINDSKLLSARPREQIVDKLIRLGIPWTIGIATAREVDRLNIRNATYLAMRRAVVAFVSRLPPDILPYILVDAWRVPRLRVPQKGIIHGDRLVKSIAAASIIAKVVRDSLMKEYDKEFPVYGLARHKGYATKFHRRTLRIFGPSSIHRRTFI